MKLKITNKWTSEIIELEGTSEELTAFMKEYKAQYPTYPWYCTTVSSSSPQICLMHDFDYSSTYPTCRKCGAPNITFVPTVTFGAQISSGIVTSSTGIPISN